MKLNTVTRAAFRQVLIAKKNSPRLFFAVGVVGVVGGAVLACKATLGLNDTLDEIKTDVQKVRDNKPTSNAVSDEVMSHYYKELVHEYGLATYKITKLYAPAIVVGGISIAALTGSHVMLSRRNAALTAAYAAVAKSYEEYRDRVRDQLGEDREREIYHGAELQELEDIDGKKIKAFVVDANALAPYSRLFDDSCPNWKKNAELNRLFIQCQESYANHRLQAYGHVFLNEVYDWLGLPRSPEGAVVGWVMDCSDGDAYINFGLFEAVNKDFIENWSLNALLDFNVHGIIYDKI